MTPARAFIQTCQQLFAEDAAQRVHFGRIHGVAWVHFVAYFGALLPACIAASISSGVCGRLASRSIELAVGGDKEVALDAHADFFFGDIDARLDGEDHSWLEHHGIVAGIVHVDAHHVASTLQRRRIGGIFVSLPMFNFASTLWLAGTHTSLHSSHDTFAFKSSGPAGIFEASVIGTSKTTSFS